MNMKDETALKVLEIAATLVEATADSGAQFKTGSGKGAKTTVESAFGDCVDAVRLHFEDLTAGHR